MDADWTSPESLNHPVLTKNTVLGLFYKEKRKPVAKQSKVFVTFDKAMAGGIKT